MSFFARMRVRKGIIMSNIDEHSTNEELVEKRSCNLRKQQKRM